MTSIGVPEEAEDYAPELIIESTARVPRMEDVGRRLVNVAHFVSQVRQLEKHQ